MQIKSYEWFFDREKRKPCLIAGTAPTIENFPFDKFLGIYITCGDGPMRMGDLFQANYWVNANPVYPIPNLPVKIINRFKDTVLIFTDRVFVPDNIPKAETLRKTLRLRWFNYNMLCANDLYLQNNGAYVKAGIHNHDLLPIQFYLKKKFNLKTHYSVAHNMAIHMLAFAVLMGCNPIYIQGVEIPWKSGDYAHRPNKEADDFLCGINHSPDKVYLQDIIQGLRTSIIDYRHWPRIIRKALKKTILPNLRLKNDDCKSVYYDHMEEILADFSYLLNLARKRGIKVYNLSMTSSLNRLKEITYLNWKTVVGRHPRNFK